MRKQVKWWVIPLFARPFLKRQLKYEGNWVLSRSGRLQPAAWVSSSVGYSPNIFGDLMIGKRECAIKPNYAKPGWNTYWENDEWWTKLPKPSLHR